MFLIGKINFLYAMNVFIIELLQKIYLFFEKVLRVGHG